MNKNISLVLVFLSLFSLIVIQEAKSEATDAIVIDNDGSILGTEKIHREGNLYTLTENIYQYPIIIQRNNIIFDGKGFTLQGASGWLSGFNALNITASNVTIQNFNINGFWDAAILGNYNDNTIFNNTITGTNKAIAIYADNYNVMSNNIKHNTYGIRILNGYNHNFSRNQLLNNFFGFLVENSTGNTAIVNNLENNMDAFSLINSDFKVYHNNFINQNKEVGGGWETHILTTDTIIPSWDNGYPSGGNYYSDYTTRYPDASEINNLGIGNTSYTINNNPTVNDRYPLLNPVNIITKTIEPPIATSSTPNETQTPTTSPNSPIESPPTSTKPSSASPTPSLQPNQSKTTAPNPNDSINLVTYGLVSLIIIATIIIIALILHRQQRKN
jgi:hypothetical protein